MSFKSKIPNNSDMWIQIILFLTLVTTEKGNVITPEFIGINCTFPEQSGHSLELLACPSQVNYQPHNVCLIPDAVRCHNVVCPGRCKTTQSSLKLCSIQWICIWRETEDNTDENTTTDVAPPNESNTELKPSTWIAIIALIVCISVIVFGGIIALIVFCIWKKLYPRGQNLRNVRFNHRGSNNNLVEMVELDQLD